MQCILNLNIVYFQSQDVVSSAFIQCLFPIYYFINLYTVSLHSNFSVEPMHCISSFSCQICSCFSFFPPTSLLLLNCILLLFCSQHDNCKEFSATEEDTSESSPHFPLPWDVPLQPYTKTGKTSELLKFVIFFHSPQQQTCRPPLIAIFSSSRKTCCEVCLLVSLKQVNLLLSLCHMSFSPVWSIMEIRCVWALKNYQIHMSGHSVSRIKKYPAQGIFGVGLGVFVDHF